jgi:hypothetical protein
VKVYYKIEKKAPVVYALVDESTLYAVIDYNKNTTTLAEAANNAGFKKNSILDIGEDNYSVNYDLSKNLKDLAAENANWSSTDSQGQAVPVKTLAASNDNVTHYNIAATGDKKLVVVSNSSDKEVAYVIVLDQYLDTVNQVDEDTTPVEYSFKTADGDLNIVTSTVAEDDYIVVTNIGLQGKVLVAYPATILSSDVTKISGISDSDASARKIVADGVTYVESKVNPNDSKLDLVTAFIDVDTLGTSSLILDQFGDMIGTAGEKSAPNYAYVAQYGVIHSTVSLNTTNALTAHIYFADGTDGIYEVATLNGVNVTKLTGQYQSDIVDVLNGSNGQATIANSKADEGGLGLWNVTIGSNGKATISIAANEETNNGDGTGASANGVRLVKGHSTFVDALGQAVEGVGNIASKQADSNGKVNKYLYQNNDTVYFYVNGIYNKGQTVEVITGVKNVVGFTNVYDSSDDTNVFKASGKNAGIQQVIATTGAANARNPVGAVLVEGIETGTSNVYYYNTGNYHYSADGLTYELYDMDGTLVEVTYSGLTKSSDIKPLDVTKADSNIYIAGSATPTDKAQSNASDDYVQAKKGSTAYYIINDTALYDEYVDNLYTKYDTVGTIAENVKIVDACGSGINSLSKLVRILKNGTGEVKIAYYFSTEDYEADVIFISDYDPSATEAPGSATATEYVLKNTYATKNSNSQFEVTGDIYDVSDDSQIANINGTVKKVTYTVSIMTASGVTTTDTYTSTSGTISNGVFTGVVPELKVSANGNLIYSIQVNVTFTTVVGTTTVTKTLSGTAKYA